MIDEIGRRDVLLPPPGVPLWDDEDQLVCSQPPEGQVRAAARSADEPEVSLTLVDLMERGFGVRDRDADLDEREAFVKLGQQMREEMLAGDGAGGELQLTRDFLARAGHRSPRLGGQFEDSSRVIVEPPARVVERDPAALAPKERRIQMSFESVGCAG